MCLEIYLGFKSQIRRHEVRDPGSCNQPHRQPAGRKIGGGGERGGPSFLPMSTEAEWHSVPFPIHPGEPGRQEGQLADKTTTSSLTHEPTRKRPARDRPQGTASYNDKMAREIPPSAVAESSAHLARQGLISTLSLFRDGPIHQKRILLKTNIFQLLVMAFLKFL